MTSRVHRPALALLAATTDVAAAAEALAQQLDLRLLPPGTDPLNSDDCDAVLVLDGDMLALQQSRRVVRRPGSGHPGSGHPGSGHPGSGHPGAGQPGSGQVAPGPVRVDFGAAAMRHRRSSGHNELVGRAVGVAKKRDLRVLDATAGLGRDGFVLADLGCEVLLCEREPVIAAMLRWGLRAAADSGDQWLAGVVGRMTLYPLDARDLTDIPDPVDVIYLDPMFPQRDKSAAVKKEMALFQLLLDTEREQADAVDLLQWALQQDVARVVVKRPPRATSLAGRPPSHSVAGKAVRYDVYVLRGLAAR